MIYKEQIKVAQENWVKASLSLSFKIITPYAIYIRGLKKDVFAFLPEYGSVIGTIINLTSPPNYEVDQDVIEWAKEKQCFYSFISIDDCQKYDEDYFKEILEDWIRYGGR